MTPFVSAEGLLSVEIRLGYQCPHFIIEEPVILSQDRQTLRTRAPVGNAGSVRILANDGVYIPPSGLDSQATLTSSSAGPYQVQRCVGTTGPNGNLFTVTTGSGTASITLPTGDRIPLARIQRELRLSSINDLVVVTESNGALSLVERDNAGPNSFIRVSGEAAASLGFLQTGARGKHVYPAWDLVARPDVFPTSRAGTVGYVPARYPKFRSKVQGNPTLKVTYTSPPERCPRCGATWVENDWRFDPKGDLITITNEDLLYQACLKAILTVQGTNAFHTGYGSKMTTRIGRKVVGASASLIKEDVLTALNQVQQLQRTQRKYQNVPNRELLFSIDSVDVRTSDEDPTVFFVDVIVRNGSNQPISLSTVFSVPGTIALAGSNNQTLGLQTAGLTAAQSARLFGG